MSGSAAKLKLHLDGLEVLVNLRGGIEALNNDHRFIIKSACWYVYESSEFRAAVY